MAQETTPDRFQRMEEIFHHAQQLPAADRPAYLAGRCAGDDAMKSDVESLLSASNEEEESAAPPAARADPWLGRELGSYRIESLLGRGGMGAVYLASRTGGDIAQTVAIKVMGSRFVSGAMTEHFKRERQILASLNHPNIARLLDGGASERGELYLVMEYVDGSPLDRFVETRKPTLRDLLALFLLVCDAVEYAHRSLVVHRDLKPGNILVTADGEAKLLDFGTAKLVDPRSPEERSRYTQLGYRAYTPEFASPEQIAGDVASAASDVYSLGAILYRLLTGKLPHEIPEGGLLPDFTRDPPRLATRLAGGADLDSVVRKALAIEPEARYLSVAAFAGDLRNLLEARPVSAREQTWSYRARRLFRRRRLEFAAGALALAALAGGLAATIGQLRVAREQEQRAIQGVRDVRGLTRVLLFEFYDAVRALPGSKEVQRSLVTESLSYLDRLQRDALDDKDLTADVIEALVRLGNLQSENLTEPDAAEKTLRKAADLARASGNSRMAASAEGNLGKALLRNGRAGEGRGLLLSATDTLSKLADRDDADTALLAECASFHGVLGGIAVAADPAGAESRFEREATLDRRAIAREPGSQNARLDLAEALINLAGFKRKPGEAAELLRSAVQALNANPDGGGNSSLRAMRIRASLLARLAGETSDGGEALQSAREAARILASVAALEPLSGRAADELAAVNGIIARLGGNSSSTPVLR